MSGKAIALVWGAPIACEAKAILTYIADCAGGNDDLGICPEIDPVKAAQRVGLTFSYTEQILMEFTAKGIIYPRHKDWSFDVIQASRFYPAPEIGEVSSNSAFKQGANG